MARLTRRNLFAVSGAGLAAGLAAPTLAQARYPSRPVQLVVPWGAGGGTDATARIVASLLERDLGQPFNVVNRTGGSGVVGHSAIATAAADGYTIGMITVEITMMHWQGLTDLKPTSYTPLALMNSDPPGVTVAQNAPFPISVPWRRLSAHVRLAASAPPARARAASGIWPWLAGCRRWGCAVIMCVGYPPTARRRPCRNLPLAALISSPAQSPKRAR